MVNNLVKVINLEYGFLESQKQVSRINLESFSNLVGVWVGVGVCGVFGVCGVVWWCVGQDYRGCHYPVIEINVSFLKTPYSRLTSRLLFPPSRIEYPGNWTLFNYTSTRVFRSSIEYVQKPFKNTLF